MYAKLGALVLAIVMAACATSSRGSSAERALVFSGTALPRCEFEVVQEITVMVSVQGDRRVAEEALHREMARSAERRDASGDIGISIQAPERVPFVVTRRPAADSVRLTARTVERQSAGDPLSRFGMSELISERNGAFAQFGSRA